MPAEVRIEAAGDHAFDLIHLRQEGGIELIARVLQEANLDQDLVWRLRVDKKITCSAETRPVAIVGWKPWCCYVKIKPGDNNSAHSCSLLMPDGLRGEQVFEALKRAEQLIPHDWRNVSREKVAIMNGASGMSEQAGAGPHDTSEVDASSPPQPANGVTRSSLYGWSKDPEKTRLALLAIHELDRAGPFSSQAHFVVVLSEKLGWEGASRYEMGGVFTSMVRRGLIMGIRRGCQPVGYTLTDEGKQFIADLLPQGEVQVAPNVAVPELDPAKLMTALTGLAQEYAGACQKLQENRARRTELMAEVERLDAEAEDLGRVVANPEVQSLLQRLLTLTGKAPA